MNAPLGSIPTMRVHVLHHGRCFDGMVSACLFFAFFREHVSQQATAAFLPKHYGAVHLFTEPDFGGDVNACVDFRYSQHRSLHWYFDHHRSAFQGDGDEEHFLADGGQQKFHDADAPSCARLIVDVARDRFGVDLTRFAELIDWADVIDRARFATPQAAISLHEPAMQLAAYIQSCDDPEQAQPLIEHLLRETIADVAKQPRIRSLVEARRRSRDANLELVRTRSQVDAGVVKYDLLSDGPRVLNHFLPYYLHPTTRYAVGAYEGSDGTLRLTVGFNPWLEQTERKHDLAAVCESHGGGGHAYVGGCTLPPGERERMRGILSSVVAHLRRDAETSGARR